MWGIIVWIVVGGIAGWLAAKVMGLRQIGCGASIGLGILGGIVGGFIVRLLGGAGVTGINIWSVIVAFFGAFVVLGVYRALKKEA